jgi:uncharacterized protein DUF87
MNIGQIIGGGKLELDLSTLVDTRLLIQANSGGGKSWLLRLIAERAGIQTIVLDNEGEFASLREAVDVLLVGASGELPANPRHAAIDRLPQQVGQRQLDILPPAEIAQVQVHEFVQAETFVQLVHQNQTIVGSHSRPWNSTHSEQLNES